MITEKWYLISSDNWLADLGPEQFSAKPLAELETGRRLPDQVSGPKSTESWTSYDDIYDCVSFAVLG